MKLEKILYAWSKSRYEQELQKCDNNLEQLDRKFKSKEHLDKIYQIHVEQKNNLNLLKKKLGSENFIDRDLLNENLVDNYELVVSLGGDDHFKYVSHIAANKLIAGVKLSKKSEGKLLNFDVNKFMNYIPLIINNKYIIENWTRIECVIKNEDCEFKPYSAVCEYFIGEKERSDMSRNEVYLNGKKLDIIQKSSGLLVVTGSGSTGWYNENHIITFDREDIFSKDKREARILATENKEKEKIKFVFSEDDLLTIVSYNDGCGIISPDSVKEHNVPFDMGYVAEIKFSNNPLKVLATEK